MVVCASGSEIKPGVAESVQITADHMASILPPQLQVLAPLYPYIRPLIIDSVSSFCASEPPGWPDLSLLTFQAILAGNEVGAGLIVAEALTQIAANAYWYLSCKCITGTTPGAPTPTAPTQPVPVVNPPDTTTPPTSTACLQSITHGPLVLNVTTRQTNYIIDVDVPTQAEVPPYTGSKPRGMFNNVTYGVAHITNDIAGAVHTQHTYVVETRAFAGAVITTSQDYPNPSGGAIDIVFPIPVGDRNVRVYGFTTSTSATNTWTGHADFYCGVAPGQQSPCCPPDPTLIGQLQQILNLVTLIQRQSVPFAYVYGTNHTSLTGDGSIAVDSLLGVSVDVTTLPSSYGTKAGTPLEIFDIGFVTLGTADGYTESRRIDHDGTLVLPRAAGVFTTVGYTLAPGVVVDIRELIRET